MGWLRRGQFVSGIGRWFFFAFFAATNELTSDNQFIAAKHPEGNPGSVLCVNPSWHATHRRQVARKAAKNATTEEAGIKSHASS